jgi:hypothetical protein
MVNRQLAERLEGIRAVLVAQGRASGTLTSASTGRERELFVDQFLRRVFPPHIRFGSGDIVDSAGLQSGQIDVVAELPFFPSFPVVDAGPRLYLAEGVAAAIEVKSNLSDQWDGVERTTAALRALSVKRVRTMWIGQEPPPLPVFAVGYRGYKTIDGMVERFEGTAHERRPHGALVLEDPGLFIRASEDGKGCLVSDGADAMFEFVAVLNWLFTKLVSAGFRAADYTPSAKPDAIPVDRNPRT